MLSSCFSLKCQQENPNELSAILSTHDNQMSKCRHMQAQMCMYKEHTHMHRERLPAQTSTLSYPQICLPRDRKRYSHTQIHPQRYSQYLLYTYKISFNIEVYLQLPTKHKFQQGHVNNTRLTFKNTLSSQTRLIPQIYCISFTDQETLKSKIPFPM